MLKSSTSTSTTSSTQKTIQQSLVSGNTGSIKEAGVLNLSNKGLCSIPEALFTAKQDALKKVDYSFDRKDPGSWWEMVDLTRLILADNAIPIMDPRIFVYEHLTMLDMRNNKIEIIPNDIQHLTQLKILVLSGNQIQQLPECLFGLPLVEVYLAHNQFMEIPDSIGQWTSVSLFDISHNQLKQVPKQLELLPKLRKLNLSHNCLLELALTQHGFLEELELHHNQLTRWSIGSFPQLKRMDLRNNKLYHLESDHVHLGSLKELHLGFNRLTRLISALKASLCSLEVLDIRDNQFECVPLPIMESRTLKRLDLTNNNISQLPPELGLVTSLDTLIFHGNPLKVPSGSTAKILKMLRERIQVKQELIEKEDHLIAYPSKILDLSNRPIDFNSLEFQVYPSELYLNQCQLFAVPNAFLSSIENGLTILKLCQNQLTEFPNVSLPQLQILDLSGNRISNLPFDLNFPLLFELNMSMNQFTGTFPASPLPFPKLTTLIVSNNKISSLSMDSLHHYAHQLQILDLTNNDLLKIPNELGRFVKLNFLGLDGNPFKIPRRNVVQAGIQALMNYFKLQLGE